jgi:AcrR family transcriptional regulator
VAKTRVQQREKTRDRIVQAAVVTFSEKGFRAASTRDIAARAGVNQGLITYYFRNKLELWKAAADRIFGGLKDSLDGLAPSGDMIDLLDTLDGREQAREGIRRYVRFAAAHPELFRLMVEEGKGSDVRMKWLVDTYLRPFYDAFQRLVAQHAPQLDQALLPSAFYAMAGASSLMFAVVPECRRLTQFDPRDSDAIEVHAEFVARLFVP